MENATKALLIAASVLIVILLITFGVMMFNSTGNVSEQAKATGEGISNQTNAAATSAGTALNDLSGWGGTSGK